MAKMMRRNLRKGICNCQDCDGPVFKGRSVEKREVEKEILTELQDKKI